MTHPLWLSMPTFHLFKQIVENLIYSFFSCSINENDSTMFHPGVAVSTHFVALPTPLKKKAAAPEKNSRVQISAEACINERRPTDAERRPSAKKAWLWFVGWSFNSIQYQGWGVCVCVGGWGVRRQDLVFKHLFILSLFWNVKFKGVWSLS